MNGPQYITLQAWAAKKFDPVPHSQTLLRWVQDGLIVPAPFRAGRAYMVAPDARHIREPIPSKTPTGRMRNGLATA